MFKILSILFCLIFSFQTGFTQVELIPIPQKSPWEKITTQVGIIDISIEYSRPSVRGRKIFGELVPYNKVWRTGANLNTRITFSKPVLIGDKALKEGTYTLFTKPGLDEWEVIIYSEYNEYGEPDKLLQENIIAKISVPTHKQNRMIETFSIRFEDLRMDGCNLVLAWERVLVKIPLNIPTSSIMNSSLQSILEKTANTYVFAATNYLNIDKDAKTALELINFALSLKEKDKSFLEWLEKVDTKDWSAPWDYQLKSEIHAELGQYEEAIKAAQRSLNICEKLEDVEACIKKNKENIAKWRE